MREIVCIACPNSCNMMVEDINSELKISGNKCKKGIEFAVSEINNPIRCVSTTVKTTLSMPVAPVRTSGGIPKAKILPLMSYLKGIIIEKPLKCGDIIVENYDNTGIDIIITTDIK